MDDDFDLFPKRENLDPFSFGKQEKKPGSEEEVDLFGQEDDVSAEPSPSREDFEEIGPMARDEAFDEPVRDMEDVSAASVGTRKKTSSPFVLIGGALVIILGLLYLALTFLIPDVPPAPAVAPPPVAVEVEPSVPPAAPVPEAEEPPSSGTAGPAAESGSPPSVVSPELAVPATVPPPAPPAGPTVTKEPAKPVAEKAPPPAAAATVQKGRYAVQVGALILEPSVRELEKRVAGLGYETYRETGSTTRVMNVVAVGPFGDMEEGRKALSLLRDSGIESTLTKRSSGDVVVNAGSFLLEKNADTVSEKVRSMGLPVVRTTKEVRLPVVFVRTGHFTEAGEADRVRDELKAKGLDALVVEVP